MIVYGAKSRRERELIWQELENPETWDYWDKVLEAAKSLGFTPPGHENSAAFAIVKNAGTAFRSRIVGGSSNSYTILDESPVPAFLAERFEPKLRKSSELWAEASDRFPMPTSRLYARGAILSSETTDHLAAVNLVLTTWKYKANAQHNRRRAYANLLPKLDNPAYRTYYKETPIREYTDELRDYHMEQARSRDIDNDSSSPHSLLDWKAVPGHWRHRTRWNTKSYPYVNIVKWWAVGPDSKAVIGKSDIEWVTACQKSKRGTPRRRGNIISFDDCLTYGYVASFSNIQIDDSWRELTGEDVEALLIDALNGIDPQHDSTNVMGGKKVRYFWGSRAWADGVVKPIEKSKHKWRVAAWRTEQTEANNLDYLKSQAARQGFKTELDKHWWASSQDGKTLKIWTGADPEKQAAFIDSLWGYSPPVLLG